jgi:hypothetical protein
MGRSVALPLDEKDLSVSLPDGWELKAVLESAPHAACDIAEELRRGFENPIGAGVGVGAGAGIGNSSPLRGD